MSPERVRNLSASVYARLLSAARETDQEFQLVLTSFALERLLYRLSQSAHECKFILKGAMLFGAWANQPHRPTQDLDLLGLGDSSVAHLEQVFRDLCDMPVENDGLLFMADTVRGEEILEEQEYGGVRIRMEAFLGRARIPLKVDIGFGDAVLPSPLYIELPEKLGLPVARLRSYSRETVIAEKFHAMVIRGMLNSRMKDYYDVWYLARNFEFDGVSLAQAIASTFDRRQTRLPEGLPVALSDEFCRDASKQMQWQAFVRRNRLLAGLPSLHEVVTDMKGYLSPPVQVLSSGLPFHMVWRPPGPWTRD